MKEVQIIERRYYYRELDEVAKLYVDSIIKKNDINNHWYNSMGRPVGEIDQLDIGFYGSP